MSLYTFADLQIASREDVPNHKLQVFKVIPTWDIWIDHAMPRWLSILYCWFFPWQLVPNLEIMRLLYNTFTKGSTGALIMVLSHSWNLPGFSAEKKRILHVCYQLRTRERILGNKSSQPISEGFVVPRIGVREIFCTSLVLVTLTI